MLRRACLFAMTALLVGTGVGRAQPRLVPISPGFVLGPPRGRIIVLGNLTPAGGFSMGVLEQRGSVEVIGPARWPRLSTPVDDVSGVDLDVTPPPWAKDVVRAPLPPPAPKKPAEEMVKAPAKAAPAQPAPPKPAPAKPNVPDPMAPKTDPVEEGQRLTLLGIAAFRGQEYGLAAQRFNQAIEVDPKASRAHFLLGQANFALGKYRDAVQMIGLGLGLDPLWPKNVFRPRFDLYADHRDDWQRHLALLEDAQTRQPNNAGYAFLLAHQRWFDDQRDDAIKLFRQVRPLVADPALVDLFLKAKGP